MAIISPSCIQRWAKTDQPVASRTRPLTRYTTRNSSQAMSTHQVARSRAVQSAPKSPDCRNLARPDQTDGRLAGSDSTAHVTASGIGRPANTDAYVGLTEAQTSSSRHKISVETHA